MTNFDRDIIREARTIIANAPTYSLETARFEYRVIARKRQATVSPEVLAVVEEALAALIVRGEYLHTAWGRMADRHAARGERLRALRAA